MILGKKTKKSYTPASIQVRYLTSNNVIENELKEEILEIIKERNKIYHAYFLGKIFIKIEDINKVESAARIIDYKTKLLKRRIKSGIKK